MGKIIGIIILVLFFGIILLIFALCIMCDILLARKYIKAQRCKGLIKKQLEDYKLTDYGGTRLGNGPRRYYKYKQYEVEYEVNGHLYTGTVQTKEKGLQVGGSVEVRYTIDDKSGEPKIVSRMYKDRIIGLAVGFVGAIILVIVLLLSGKISL